MLSLTSFCPLPKLVFNWAQINSIKDLWLFLVGLTLKKRQQQIYCILACIYEVIHIDTWLLSVLINQNVVRSKIQHQISEMADLYEKILFVCLVS